MEQLVAWMPCDHQLHMCGDRLSILQSHCTFTVVISECNGNISPNDK